MRTLLVGRAGFVKSTFAPHWVMLFGSPNRSFYLAFGSMIAPHGVDRDRQHGRARRLLFGDFDDFAALILSAVRANAMRQFRFVAIGAVRHHGAAQGIMRPPGGSPPLGMSSFRIRHFTFSAP